MDLGRSDYFSLPQICTGIRMSAIETLEKLRQALLHCQEQSANVAEYEFTLDDVLTTAEFVFKWHGDWRTAKFLLRNALTDDSEWFVDGEGLVRKTHIG